MLGLGSLGGGGGPDHITSADTELILTPPALLGAGVPDFRATLLGEAAIDILQGK